MRNRNDTHVALLKGGWSAEREVSLTTAKGVGEALRSKGYRVTEIDVTPNLADDLKRAAPDVVFNALHGRWGEDGCVQGVLEIMGIPYTHSGVLASALAMDKAMAKIHFAAASLPVPKGRVVTRAEVVAGDVLPRPYVLKPIAEGSSVGVYIFQPGDNQHFTDATWPYKEDQVLAEEYIQGREIQCAVFDDKAIGAIEIRPKNGFYDYEAKYTDGKADHLMPAPIHPAAYAEVMRIAEAAHKALGCRGLTRSDLLYDDRAGEPGKVYLLEVNTQPGMTPLSLAPEIAAHAGIGYADLVDRLVESALCNFSSAKAAA